ncbi:Transglycosylase SLT domain protein [uncultured archaeon]|nr:Transglycosylase SLT domain protein [uncultured archaeon]
MMRKIINNKRGDLPITLLVIGVVLVCCIAIFTFFSSTITIKNHFAGIELIEQLNANIEQNHFNNLGGGTPKEDINKIFEYAKTHTIKDRICSCGDYCDSLLAGIINSASSKGIDPVLLLSVIMQESGCRNDKIGDNGKSIGLMQINIDAHCSGSPTEIEQCKNNLLDIKTNINFGAQLLKEDYDNYKEGKDFQCSGKNAKYTEWEAALRAYNGWSCGGNDNYVEETWDRYTALKKTGFYLEKKEVEGILWWAKEITSFSVQYTAS